MLAEVCSPRQRPVNGKADTLTWKDTWSCQRKAKGAEGERKTVNAYALLRRPVLSRKAVYASLSVACVKEPSSLRPHNQDIAGQSSWVDDSMDICCRHESELSLYRHEVPGKLVSLAVEARAHGCFCVQGEAVVFALSCVSGSSLL